MKENEQIEHMRFLARMIFSANKWEVLFTSTIAYLDNSGWFELPKANPFYRWKELDVTKR